MLKRHGRYFEGLACEGHYTEDQTVTDQRFRPDLRQSEARASHFEFENFQ